MKTLAILLLLVALTFAAQDCPGGTQCSAGCCPIPNAVCCTSGETCCSQGWRCDSTGKQCFKGNDANTFISATTINNK